MGDDSTIISEGQGTVDLENGFFSNVLYVPSLAGNLLSVYQMTHIGMPKRVSFIPNDVEIIEIASGKLNAKGLANHHAKAYEFSHFVADEKPTALLNNGNEVSRLWHERFDHLNFNYSNYRIFLWLKASRSSKPPLEFARVVLLESTLSIISIEGRQAEHHASWDWSDISGPMPITSVNGSRYVLTLIVDFSKYTWVFFIKKKSEVLEKFIELKALIENASRKK